MDILDDMRVRKLSAKVLSKVNYSFKQYKEQITILRISSAVHARE